MDIRLPRLGEGADSGSVVSVLVKEGDHITKDQPLIELENEKAVAAIPSTASGTVTKVHVRPGDKIAVGQVIVSLSENGGAREKAAGETSRASATIPTGSERPQVAPARALETTRSAVALPASSEGGAAPVASPSIRKMARELGIDLANVRGSERGGRIVLEDLRTYIQGLQRFASRPPSALSQARIDFSQWGPVTKKPMSSMRRTIAQRMAASWTTIPHVTQFEEADITALLALKKTYDPIYEQNGARLTVTAFLLKAVVAGLKAYPMFNASLDESTHDIVYKHYYHLGIAVDTDAGLIVPVMKNADQKTLLELSKELNALAEKSRQRTVTAEELQGGTFSISNQGGIGGAHFTPIIKKPEVAILGVGKGALKPVVKHGTIEPRMLLPLALSYDHRVIDGADAARFIRDLVQAIEQFKESDVKI